MHDENSNNNDEQTKGYASLLIDTVVEALTIMVAALKQTIKELKCEVRCAELEESRWRAEYNSQQRQNIDHKEQLAIAKADRETFCNDADEADTMRRASDAQARDARSEKQYWQDRCFAVDRKLSSLQVSTEARTATAMQHRLNALQDLAQREYGGSLAKLDHTNPLIDFHLCNADELELIANSQKIGAVRAYRKRTGEGISKAKGDVEKAGAIHGFYI